MSLKSAVGFAKEQLFRRFKTLFIVKMFSSNSLFTTDSWPLIYLSSFFRLSFILAYRISVRRSLDVFAHNISFRSLCTAILTAERSPFSSAAIICMHIVESCALRKLRFLLTFIAASFSMEVLAYGFSWNCRQKTQVDTNNVRNASEIDFFSQQVWHTMPCQLFSDSFLQNTCKIVQSKKLAVYSLSCAWFHIIFL